MQKLDVKKLDEVLQPLRDKYEEVKKEIEKLERSKVFLEEEIYLADFNERERQFALPYVPTSSEDETPDNDNPFQGREDDERVTSQLD